MGKNISGAGIDPNVIGFWRRQGGARTPDFRTLVVLDITIQSHGNAMGIGMADLTTKRVMGKIDLEATYTNALTTGIFAAVRWPIALEDEPCSGGCGPLPRARHFKSSNGPHHEYTGAGDTLGLPEKWQGNSRGQDGIEVDDAPRFPIKLSIPMDR